VLSGDPPAVAPRTSRTTDHPSARSEGSSAAPIGPDTPLTRILEFMAENATLPAGGASEQTADGFETFVTGETQEALISYSEMAQSQPSAE